MIEAVWKIEVGDTVYVVWRGGNTLSGVVMHVPRDRSECWVVRDDDCNIHYIQQFQRISRGARKG